MQKDLLHLLKDENIKITFEAEKSDKTTDIETNEDDRAPQPTEELYYYHPDHLGTATFLTDNNGNPYQFFLNLPFGETMAEQRSSSGNFNNRWKFNGKELDEETGLYYYGARFYNPSTSLWLSVDPLVEQTMDAYGYCYQNPINLIDPTGMSPEDGDDIITINNKGTVIDVVKNNLPNEVFQKDDSTGLSTKVDNIDKNTRSAKDVKKGDKIIEGELFRIVEGVKILRKDIDLNGDDKYGHWWTEIGSSESYGWWPKSPVGLEGTLTGVEGELNASAFGGTSTTDPHHGDRSVGVNKFNLYTRNATKTNDIADKIRAYANSYSGSWSWPIGQNCHSFQDGFISKFNLTIDPKASKSIDSFMLKDRRF